MIVVDTVDRVDHVARSDTQVSALELAGSWGDVNGLRCWASRPYGIIDGLAPHRPPGLVGLFRWEFPTLPDLRAVLVVDYQNVHLTAHELFAVSRHLPRHESLVDPLHFGNQLIAARNRDQRPGMDHAVLAQLLVFRGQPSAEHDPKPYARNQAQKAQWERDQRVSVIHRPLKYRYERDETGRVRLSADGKRIVEGKGEKGIDVLCALAVVREAQRLTRQRPRTGAGRGPQASGIHRDLEMWVSVSEKCF